MEWQQCTNSDAVSPCANDSGYLSEQEIVHSLPRLSLRDNGQRNWQEESRQYLDRYYPVWKAPETTRMVPPVFHGTSSGAGAEEKIFSLIEEFGKKFSEPMFVLHSYDFAALIENAEKGYCKREWVKGECDFVIIHHHAGLLFIEVKSKESTKKVYNDGLKQISKIRKAVLSFTKKIFPVEKKKAFEKEIFMFPGFVAMPNCCKQESYDCGVFKEDCQDVQSFKTWWDNKIVRTDDGINQHIYEALMVRLAPRPCVAPTFSIQTENTYEKITKLYTPKQLKILLQTSPKQWITGPAGSGKTVLLLEKVKEVIFSIMTTENRSHERVLILCYNRPLSVYLTNEMNDWFESNFKEPPEICMIKTYDSFLMKLGGFSTFDPANRDLMEKKYRCQNPTDEELFHHVFVDEGQDLPGNWLELLEKFFRKENPYQQNDIQYYFWIMFDSCQHIQFNGKGQQLRIRLKDATRLTQVIRNTKRIFHESIKYFDGKIELGHTEVGMNVVFDDSLDGSNDVASLSYYIDWLLKEKVERKDIVVLTRNMDVRDFVIKELTQQNPAFHVVNAEDRLRCRKDAIAIESVRRFKGLESKVVIVYNPEYSTVSSTGLNNKARELLYVAMSRCICYLVIVSTKKGCRCIQSGNLPTSECPSPQVMAKIERGQVSQGLNEVIHTSHSMKDSKANGPSYKRNKESMKMSYKSAPPKRKRYVGSENEDGNTNLEAIESDIVKFKFKDV